jgi:glycosyltransferase involved in cell wall biosynthesis
MSRILHIGKFFPPFAGGIENFLADLIPAQIQQGETVAALVHDHQPRWRPPFFGSVYSENFESCTIYRAPCYGRLLYAPISPQFPFWLNRVLYDFQPTILHLHVPNTSAFFALWLSRARRIPWIIHWHADVETPFNPYLSIAYKFYRPLEQRLLAHAQRIIVTSPPYLMASRALARWQNKCQVIPLGIALSRLPMPTDSSIHWAEQQWQPDQLRVLSVGRLTYYKGHEILISAIAKTTKVQVLIVGEGEKRQDLASQINQLNLSQQVKLLGYCSEAELTALLATCDCFCLPSLERSEAFGVVLLEAMRYKKPIIASAIAGSGVTWVVQDGQTGILVPPTEITALAQALQFFQADPRRGVELGATGYQRFLQLFDINQVAKEISTLYQEIV